MGLDNASGEFLMFCDADDWYEPAMCEQMLSAIETNGADMAICHSNIVRLAPNRRNPESFLNKNISGLYDMSSKKARKHINVLLWNKIVRKSVVDSANIRFPDGYLSDDNLFVYEYIATSLKVFFTREKLYNYALAKNSITSISQLNANIEWIHISSHFAVVEKLYNFLKTHEIYEQNITWLSNILRIEMRGAYNMVGDADLNKYMDEVRKLVCAIDFSDLELPVSFMRILCAAADGLYAEAQIYTRDFYPNSEKTRRKWNNQDETTPAFINNNIPIAFACDDNFVNYLCVAIQSVMTNASDRDNYDIIILTEGLSPENRDKIDILRMEHKKASIRLVYIQPYINDALMSGFFTRSKITKMAYVRMFLHRILKHYKKVLYLDCDLVAEADVAELFNIDLRGKALAAVRDRGITNPLLEKTDKYWTGAAAYYSGTLSVTNMADYFNSGVLVMNLDKIRAQDLEDEFIRVARINNRYCMDQNVLNAVLKNDVLLLPTEWNYQAVPNLPLYVFAYSDCKRIIHYVARNKPLNSANSLIFSAFWKYAGKLPFYIQPPSQSSSCDGANYGAGFGKWYLFSLLPLLDIKTRGVTDTKIIRLFGFLPLMVIRYKRGKTIWRLFGFAPIMLLRHKDNCKIYRLFGFIPLLKYRF
jgi:lipopolysaccharide biosynthesis glycosyltransferase